MYRLLKLLIPNGSRPSPLPRCLTHPRLGITVLVKPEGKRLRGKPKLGWEDNIIWDLKKLDYEGNWKTLAQDRVTCSAHVLVAVNLRVP